LTGQLRGYTKLSGYKIFWLFIKDHERITVMGKVALDKSMSLDGYITGPNPTPAQALGEGGDQIFAWMMANPDAEGKNETGMLSDAWDEMFGPQTIEGTGAVVMGKRMFEMIDNPNGWVAPNGFAFPWPVFVLTHEVRQPETKGISQFTFVNDGIESALEQAHAAAGDKYVGLGGANVAQQAIRAGVLDEISIHLVPVFLGGGVRLFDDLGVSPRELEFVGGQQLAGVTHLRFRFTEANANT
jgi:dihydrofolate reductase